ncbi:hypothetical protein SCHPADRAFT_909695 [Schizopora paradoxa]|uniref:BTB domain-containing protein n=1 Tax=Schizopora paradoxa TaxID=27342 RepID=A0A0H2R770_9AGAM|nr:hypothetical protein SCHPADRAFT_909695 [Schizopora paradoxa]
MPPKRRRTNESSHAEDGGQEENLATTKPQPHEDFWFEDGSIVLATDIHLYRVHKGMLSRFSKVLNDLFELPPGDADEDRWEGVPIVRMAGDSDEEVVMLLKALYGMSLREELHGLTLSEIASLLSISSKYEFQDIRAIVTQYLESLFPATLKEYKASKIHERGRTPNDLIMLFDLIVVAHRCEALIILPVLYYLCAQLHMQFIVGRLDTFPTRLTKTLLLCRSEICEYYGHRIIEDALQVMLTGTWDFLRICGSSHCLEEFRAQLAKDIGRKITFTSVFDVPERGILEGRDMEHSKICKDCATRYISLVDIEKERAWDQLPRVVLGKEWTELKQR